jgi:hypothetical protein
MQRRAMPNRQTFGRRTSPQTQTAAPVRPAPIAQPAPSLTLEAPPPVAPAEDEPSVDQELLEWKRARGSKFEMPWRQLSLMASLCFGIASFVLPDSVNNSVEWLLWALSAMSAMVWFTNRKAKKLKDSAAP